MVSSLIVSGAVIIIIFRFRREVLEGYTYVEKEATLIRSKVLPIFTAHTSNEYLSISNDSIFIDQDLMLMISTTTQTPKP